MALLEEIFCWKALRRALSLLRRIFPLTRAGASLAVIDGFALWAEGMRHQSLLLLAAAGVVLAIQCGLTLVVVAGGSAARYFSRRQAPFQPLALDTEGSQATGFAAASLAWLPFMTLTWDWRLPGGVEVEVKREHGQLREYVHARHRLASDSIQRQFLRSCIGAMGAASLLAGKNTSIL